jgi:hypothetical protein
LKGPGESLPNLPYERRRSVDGVSTASRARSRVECLRTLDRLRLAGGMADRELTRRRATAIMTLEAFEVVRLGRRSVVRGPRRARLVAPDAGGTPKTSFSTLRPDGRALLEHRSV